jgi:hypothetical protein
MIIFLVVLALAFFVVGCYFYGEAKEKALGAFLVILGFVCQFFGFWAVLEGIV